MNLMIPLMRILTLVVDLELVGNDVSNIITAGSGDDIIYGGGGNDTIEGGGGLDNFYAGSGDDIINFGVDENGTGTYGNYSCRNDQININDEWAWLHYDYKDELQQHLYFNFSDQDQVIDGVSLDPFTVRDQYNDVDTFLNTDKGAHFWGSEFDDEIIIGDVEIFIGPVVIKEAMIQLLFWAMSAKAFLRLVTGLEMTV